MLNLLRQEEEEQILKLKIPKKLEILPGLKNLYKEEITFNRDRDLLNYDLLKRFLDDNVLKIEKLNKKFVDNIILIIEDNKIFNLELGIKKKNYNPFITTEYLENSLIEAKDLFRENYQDQEILRE